MSIKSLQQCSECGTKKCTREANGAGRWIGGFGRYFTVELIEECDARIQALRVAEQVEIDNADISDSLAINEP